MEVTLGGDRLGGGKKNKVHMHGYGRSNHNIGYVVRTTMSPGTLVPFMKELGLPGTTMDIKYNVDVKTLPAVGPLFGHFKLHIDTFKADLRLYQGKLHNNGVGLGMKMDTLKLPIMKLYATVIDPNEVTAGNIDINNAQINPSAVLRHLDICGVGMRKIDDPEVTRDFQAVPYLAYVDIYKNYYSNKQEEIGAVIHSTPVLPVTNVTAVEVDGSAVPTAPLPPGAIPIGNNSLIEVTYTGSQTLSDVMLQFDNGLVLPVTEVGILISDTGGVATFSYKWAAYGNATVLAWRYVTQNDAITSEITIKTFPLADIDTMRYKILAHAINTSAFDISAENLAPYKYIFEQDSGGGNVYTALMYSQEGLLLRTYKSDLLNNWLNTDWIDGVGGITEITAVDTSTGEFTLDQLVVKKAMWNLLNRVGMSGGTVEDYMKTVYDVERNSQPEIPTYEGGLIQTIAFQEVVSNSGSATESVQPLGTLAGRGIMANDRKGGELTIRFNEWGYAIGIVSIVPVIDYSQGNNWDVHLKTFDDFHKPEFDQIGFQELITEQFAWWDTHQLPDGTWNTKSAGKQPAWINYRTNINRIRGNFASNQAFMVLARNYEAEVNATFLQIKDLTTYIDPKKYNQIFAQTSLDSQNFWVQIGIDITARRKMSTSEMPNL